jgi:hypothetical protein
MGLPFILLGTLSCIFKYSSFFCILNILTIIFHGEVLFWPYLSGVLKAPCIWMTISFSKFRKCSAITLLNMIFMSSHFSLFYTHDSWVWSFSGFTEVFDVLFILCYGFLSSLACSN